MKTKTLVLLFLIGFLVLPSASAAYTMTTPGLPHVISRAAFEKNHVINITINGTDPLTTYQWKMLAGRGMDGYPDPSLTTIITGDFQNGSFTHDTTLHLPLTLSYYRYDVLLYWFAFVVTEYWTSNHTGKGVNHILNFGWNITSSDLNTTYYLMLNDAKPRYLDLYGGDALTQGLSYTVSCLKKNGASCDYVDIPVYWFMTDNTSSRHLIAWDTHVIHYDPAASKGAFYDPAASKGAFGYGTLLMNWTESIKKLVDLGDIRYFSSYYVYIGVMANSPFTTSNIYWTVDDSVQLMNFSIGTPYLTTSHLIEYNLGYGAGDRFIGVMNYFETTPSAYSHNGWNPGSMAANNWGAALDSFGMMIGIPFFSVLIAFMVCAICAVIPWRLAIKYDFNLPNFIYGSAVVAGMILNLVLTIISIWMFALFIGVIALILFLGYRETIEKTLGFATGVPVAERNLGKRSSQGFFKAYKRFSDEGTRQSQKNREKMKASGYLHEIGHADIESRKPLNRRISNVLVTTVTKNGKVHMNSHQVNDEKRRKAKQ